MKVDYDKASRLADMSAEACAIRLVAARKTAGMSQSELADAAGLKNNALNNMEKARQFPNRQVMKFLYRMHRIDFNFLMYGEHHQLPVDVREALMAHLAHESDGSGQSTS